MGAGVTRWLSPPRGSNYFSGGVDLAAPATGVPVIIPRALGSTGVGGGTSIAAPMVAGVAAHLLDMSPSLSGRELKRSKTLTGEDEVEGRKRAEDRKMVGGAGTMSGWAARAENA